MLQEFPFDAVSECFLSQFSEALEAADARGILEVEYVNGILTLTANDRKIWVINRHAPSKQLWLASPVSGGLHFSYDRDCERWQLADGRELAALVMAELQSSGAL